MKTRSVSSVRTSVAESIARVQPGYETDLLYMAGLFAIVLGGVCFTTWVTKQAQRSAPQHS